MKALINKKKKKKRRLFFKDPSSVKRLNNSLFSLKFRTVFFVLESVICIEVATNMSANESLRNLRLVVVLGVKLLPIKYFVLKGRLHDLGFS